MSVVQLVCVGCLLHASGGSAQAQPRDQDDSTEVKVVRPRFSLRGRGKGGFDKWHKKPARFQLVEATIDDIHAALKTGRLSCSELVTLYLERIEAYSGSCTAYLDEQGNAKPADLFMPSGKTIQLGPLTAIANAGQLNAFSNLNVRGMRSETDLTDSDPAIPDALEVAATLDAYFDSERKLVGPLHCIPFAIKDQVDTYDMRTTDAAIADYANDRPPADATVVAKLRSAGAIILGKANMGEYASGTRSTYQGQTCNPYATDRNPGGSSAGSGAAVAANLVACAIAEESLGSIRNPASMQGVVGVAPSRGLISREGNYRANLIRERLGPHCRTVKDTAIVLDAVAGYDAGDPITALSVGNVPVEGYAAHANRRSLRGKRIGVLRELMTRFSVADENSIALMNQAIADMRSAGATVLETVNARDCNLFGACGDPGIPDMKPTVQDAIEEMLPYLEPSFVGPPTPADAWPTLTRLVPEFTLPPGYATFMDYIVAEFFDHSLFPHQIGERSPNLVINLRRLSSGAPPGQFAQGKYAFNRYLIKRGDANIRSVADLNDVITPCTQSAFESGFCGKARALFVGKNPPNDTATRLDLPGDASHLYRQQSLREIILHVMAANKLDALIYPHHTVPSALLFQPSTVSVENRPTGGWNALTDVSGLPDMVVPGGFTREAYDVVPCTEPGAVADPAAPTDMCLVRREVALPFAISFLGRPFDEAGLFEITSGYESVSMHRRPPTDFGPLPGEP